MGDRFLYPLDQLQDHLHLRVFEAHSLPIGPTWNARDVRSSYWRLYVNNRRGASLKLAARDYALAPRRVHFVPAWVLFSCQCTRTLEHFYVHFDVIGWPGTLVRQVFDAPATLGRNPVIHDRIAHLSRRLRQPADVATLLEIKSVVYHALSALIGSLPAEKAARFREHAGGDDAVSSALRHIDAHLRQPITNAQLADRCHLSEDHFIRRFRARVGQTPAQYVLERRVVLAAQRLAFGQDKIEQIADECGFANRFYFTRVFTRVMGVSPARYRTTARV